MPARHPFSRCGHVHQFESHASDRSSLPHQRCLQSLPQLPRRSPVQSRRRSLCLQYRPAVRRWVRLPHDSTFGRHRPRPVNLYMCLVGKMEARLTPKEQADGREEGEEEDYVFLDLDDVYEYTDIPANVPYVLSGLNTLKPVLIIDDKLKLIGEYEETIGTCYVFSEGKSETVLVHQETGPSEANLFEDISIIDPNQAASRQVKPLASLHKVIKFRLANDDEIRATSTDNATN